MHRYRILEIFLISNVFWVSNVLVLFNEAEVIGFLKYCFGTKLIDRFCGKKHCLMSLFLLVVENVWNPESEHNLVLLAKILLSNILENVTTCS